MIRLASRSDLGHREGGSSERSSELCLVSSSVESTHLYSEGPRGICTCERCLDRSDDGFHHLVFVKEMYIRLGGMHIHINLSRVNLEAVLGLACEAFPLTMRYLKYTQGEAPFGR